MNYTIDEVMQYVLEEDVKFIRMAFCDVYGRQKNAAVMAPELPRAFEHGIAIDASAIDGFDMQVRSDLFLRPNPGTLTELPWRPQQGRVAHMFCDIVHPDGSPFEADTRQILKQAVAFAKSKGFSFSFGTEMEFYLFKLDEDGKPTKEPFDNASYMDVAPDDLGENVRREICLTLEQMGMFPESSHHESGPGQNEIDFRYADPLSAADNAVLFKSVVKAVAARNGLHADFSPRPLEDCPGSGMHINISAKRADGTQLVTELIPGLMDKIREMSLFLNPVRGSYLRLGRDKAPAWVSWSEENRSQLIRVPAACGEYRRVELRSPDAAANPYLAFALIIYAAVSGMEQGLALAPASDLNAFSEAGGMPEGTAKLPASIEEAAALARGSGFIREHIPETVIESYCGRKA